MDIRLWHGWQRVPLDAGTAPLGPLRSRDGHVYFGIVPRGLLTWLGRAALPAEAAGWAHAAPWLELLDTAPDGARDARFAPWAEAARAAGVLSVRQSAELCTAFVTGLHQRGTIEALDLWLIKEGHTSSVWHVEMHTAEGSSVIAVNVARDREAGVELAASYRQMVAWHALDPEHVAEPLGIDERLLHPQRPERAVATAHAWVPGRELHARPRSEPARANEAELVEIEGFVPEPDTGRLRALGRVLDAAEQNQAWMSLVAFLDRHRDDRSGHAAVLVPGLEISDGDVVWTGRDIVVIGACAAPRVLSDSEWTAFVSAPHIEWRPGGPRLARPAW